jgi:DNA-binding NarL/FixJ family response regulator
MSLWTTTSWVPEPEKEALEDLDLVWVSCPHKEEEEEVVVVAPIVKEALAEKSRVYIGKEPPPPQKEDPCCVLLCTSGEGIVSEMRRLQSQAPNSPVVVFSQTKEPRLVAEALRAGASGFVHAGMRARTIALALALASEGEVLIPREVLGELLGQRLFLRRPWLLDP